MTKMTNSKYEDLDILFGLIEQNHKNLTSVKDSQRSLEWLNFKILWSSPWGYWVFVKMSRLSLLKVSQHEAPQ